MISAWQRCITSTLCLLSAFGGNCGVALSREASGKGDPMYVDRASDAELAAARAEAQRTLPYFLAVLANPPAGVSEIEFKFPLGGTEDIWVGNVVREGDYLTGTLANEPNQPGFVFGDAVRVPLRLVTDWGYRMPDGRIRGHRTTRVLLRRVTGNQAAMIRDFLGED